MPRILTDEDREEFDAALTAARALLDDADPDNDDEARAQVRAIKRARRTRRKDRREERRAEGGGFWGQVIAALVDEERAQALLERELRDVAGRVITGRDTPAEALVEVGESFKAEVPHIIKGADVVPVLKKFGVPGVIASAIGWGIDLADGPLAVAAWNRVEAEALRRLEAMTEA